MKAETRPQVYTDTGFGGAGASQQVTTQFASSTKRVPKRIAKLPPSTPPEVRVQNDLEKDIVAVTGSIDQTAQLWKSVAGEATKTELDPLTDKLRKRWPQLTSSTSALQALERLTGAKGGAKGTWVDRERFPKFLKLMCYYNRLNVAFATMDVDGDSALGIEEFRQSNKALGLKVSAMDSKVAVLEMDVERSGQVRFAQLAEWFLARKGFGLPPPDAKKGKGKGKRAGKAAKVAPEVEAEAAAVAAA